MLQSLAPEFRVKKPYLALMLDYDGTLAPIVMDPEQAYPAPETIELLKRLSHNPTIKLAIISGRSINQLKTFLGELLIDPIFFCGLHGGQIQQYPDDLTLCSPSASIPKHISHFKKRLSQTLESKDLIQLVLLEDKTFSLALHYRWTPAEKKEAVIECFEQLYRYSDSLSEMFRLQPGKEVIELVPTAFNKGACVRFLTRYWQEQEHLTPDRMAYTYVGDDLTDEYAFDVVRQLGGNAVLINNETSTSSTANMHLNSISDLHQMLEGLLGAFPA